MYENELSIMRGRLGLNENASLEEISEALEKSLETRLAELEKRRNSNTPDRASLLEQAEASVRDVRADIESLKKMRDEIEKAKEGTEKTEEIELYRAPAGDGEIAAKRYLRLFSEQEHLDLTDEEIDKFYKEEKITKDGKTYVMEKESDAYGYDDGGMDEFVIKMSKEKEKKKEEVEYELGDSLYEAPYEYIAMPRYIKLFSDKEKLDFTDDEIRQFIKDNKITKDGKTYVIEREHSAEGYDDGPIDMFSIKEQRVKERQEKKPEKKKPEEKKPEEKKPEEKKLEEKKPEEKKPEEKKPEEKKPEEGKPEEKESEEKKPDNSAQENDVSEFKIKYNGRTGNYLLYSIYSDGEKTVSKMGRFDEAEKTSTKKRISALMKNENIKSFINNDNIPSKLKKRSVLKKADPTILRLLCTYGNKSNNYEAATAYLSNLLHKKNENIELFDKNVSLSYDIPVEDSKLSFMMKMAKSHKKMAEIIKPTFGEIIKNVISKIKHNLLPSIETRKQIEESKKLEQRQKELQDELTPEQKAHIAKVVEARKNKRNAAVAEERANDSEKADSSEEKKLPNGKEDVKEKMGFIDRLKQNVSEAEKNSKTNEKENKFGKLSPEEQKEMEENIKKQEQKKREGMKMDGTNKNYEDSERDK